MGFGAIAGKIMAKLGASSLGKKAMGAIAKLGAKNMGNIATLGKKLVGKIAQSGIKDKIKKQAIDGAKQYATEAITKQATNFGNRIVNTLEQKANNVLERNKEGVNRTENAIATANRVVNTIANQPTRGVRSQANTFGY